MPLEFNRNRKSVRNDVHGLRACRARPSLGHSENERDRTQRQRRSRSRYACRCCSAQAPPSGQPHSAPDYLTPAEFASHRRINQSPAEFACHLHFRAILNRVQGQKLFFSSNSWSKEPGQVSHRHTALNLLEMQSTFRKISIKTKRLPASASDELRTEVLGFGSDDEK